MKNPLANLFKKGKDYLIRDGELKIIDEVQLAADYERGHIFTDKILNHKGEQETMFLGSDSIEILLKYIYPNILIKRMRELAFLNKGQSIILLAPERLIISATSEPLKRVLTATAMAFSCIHAR